MFIISFFPKDDNWKAVLIPTKYLLKLRIFLLIYKYIANKLDSDGTGPKAEESASVHDPEIWFSDIFLLKKV